MSIMVSVVLRVVDGEMGVDGAEVLGLTGVVDWGVVDGLWCAD